MSVKMERSLTFTERFAPVANFERQHGLDSQEFAKLFKRGELPATPEGRLVGSLQRLGNSQNGQRH